MTVVISLFNQAGGVGKSTLTQNLGYHLSLRRHKVLLVDIDPQASLSTFMGLEPGSNGIRSYPENGMRSPTSHLRSLFLSVMQSQVVDFQGQVKERSHY